MAAVSPTKRGYMKKKSDKTLARWQKRWFVLRSHYLSYYEDEQAKTPSNTWNLRFVSDLRRQKEQPQELFIEGKEVSIVAVLRNA